MTTGTARSRSVSVKALPAINEATGAPWVCVTTAVHQCSGAVVGAVGAYPVCEAGAVAEIEASAKDRERINRWVAANADVLAAEGRREHEFEREYNR